MPEFPDIELYLHALSSRILEQPLEDVRLRSAFLLRSVDPPFEAFWGKKVVGLFRIGKRVVWQFEDELFFVFHLMISGRFQWKKKGTKIPPRAGLAAFDFSTGTLLMTEVSKKKRAKLHLVRGRDGLKDHDPGGLEPLSISCGCFEKVLRKNNHTIKRALTDPRILAGIGNAYSDEILFAARLPPHIWTSRLRSEEIKRLYVATHEILNTWRDRLIHEVGDDWPTKVTAFRSEMNVHGKYGEPCNVCGAAIQRVAFANNEMNYCANCQNEGKLLADRGLSRLLKGDWPKTLEQLEEMKRLRTQK